jgi:HEAT repeat protein/TolA-binding protein
MQKKSTTQDNSPRTARRAPWAVALVAMLAVAAPVLGAQAAPPAPPRPTPSPRPARAQEAPPPQPVEPAEAPEPPEPVIAPEPPDFDFDYDIDFDFGGFENFGAFYNGQLDMLSDEMRQLGANLEHLRGQDFGRELAKATEPAYKAYLEGRQLLSESEWEKGLGKFNEVISQYGQSKHVDGSLFWSAYALKKLGRYQDAWRVSERLVSEYPKSRWRDEVDALRGELAPLAGQPVPEEIRQRQEEELKIEILRGLMHGGNPQRGVDAARDILKQGSTASQRLKLHAVILLSQVDGQQATDVLVGALRTETDSKVRKQIIVALGQRAEGAAGAAIFEELKRIAMGDDVENAKMAVVALGQNDDPRSVQFLAELARGARLVEVRRQALVMLSQNGGQAGCDTLLDIHRRETDAEMKKFAFVHLVHGDCPQAFDVLVDTARNGATVDERRFAIMMLAQRDETTALDLLLTLYDSAKDEETKQTVIMALGQKVDDSKPALRKLMQIAKSEPSLQLRKLAIMHIGRSDDPEALSFLESLLK